MAVVAISDSILSDIADAIRSKNGTSNTYKPSQMPDAIEAISGGGITPTGTKEITANGTGVDVASYAYADVSVPNSYSAGDEGKVVSNGALVAQTSDTVTSNDTYDTTLINSLTVNVSGGGSGVSTLLNTITATEVRATKIDIDSSWLNTYDLLLIVPNLTFSGSDYLYRAQDATSSNSYTPGISGADERYTTLITKPMSSGANPSGISKGWQSGASFTVSSYLYFYMYSSSKTMTGDFRIYGVIL